MLRSALLFFGTFFIVIVAIGILSVWNVRNMIETEQKINNTNRIFYELEQLISNAKDLYLSARTYVITGDTTDLMNRKNINRKTSEGLRILQSMMKDSLALADLNQLSAYMAIRAEDFVEVVIRKRKEKGFYEAQKFFSENRNQVLITDLIPQLIYKIKSREQALLDESVTVSDQNADKTIKMVVTGTFASILLVLSALHVIRKDRIRIGLDMKQIEKAKSELEVLANQLQRQNSRLLNFSQITSHNLRSPVSNLNSLLHFYKESTRSEDREMLLGKFETVINHLTSTLNDLTEALKIQEDLSKESELVTFKEIFDKTLESLSGHLMETGAIVTSDFSKAESIEYPKSYLESIMLNLFSNALKYRSPHRTPQIHFQTMNIGDKVILTVRDNGVGIDLHKHGGKLFGLNTTFHNHPDAKGVGLYITKTQVEAMGGEISADSTVDKGTTFKVVFRKE
ncbi:MAG: ATP-binding protein [Cyclobacteriaceae bacterium]|nr:ATP-binding protein [Cyclobacteriaceae bacterium]MDH4297135.1 ATP-binding protein [Cyclobacteriaceae bacterium]MDH5247905.1 ATP-binding protein [Cyclobacteriaceae bacterium]